MQQAKVFVQGRPFNGAVSRVFQTDKDHRYKIVQSIEDSDVVAWTGGEDIDPSLYGERPLRGTYYSLQRDREDVAAAKKAFGLGKFLVGICRGAQLLNVIPNGGSLWQHVDHHAGCIHRCFDCVTGTWIEVNSVHHQMMIPTAEAELVAWAKESTERYSWGKEWVGRKKDFIETDSDPEALWYPKTKSLLVQFHPEFNFPPAYDYFHRLMDTYYWNN